MYYETKGVNVGESRESIVSLIVVLWEENKPIILPTIDLTQDRFLY